MKSLRWSSGLLFLLFICCSQGDRSYKIQSKQQLQLSIDSLMSAYVTDDSPGAAVMVVYKGDPLIKKGYGLRNVASGEPITPTTNMRMASVSKQFTALCILTLIEQGKMKLEDQALDYLPYPIFKGISIEQLMKHTSGLPDYYDHFEENWPRDKVVENADVLNWLKTNPDRDFEPGTRWEYSNTAYLMLAVIVEQVSGMEFSAYAKSAVFERLGMDRTQYYNLAKPVEIPERSLCHGKEKGVFKAVDGFFMNGVMGDGAVYTNLEDYLRFDQILRKDSILSEKVYELIWKPGAMPVSENVYYGSGWFLRNNNEDSMHSGGWFGTSTYIYRGLKNGLTIVVFCNATDLLPPKKVAEEMRLRTDAYLAAR